MIINQLTISGLRCVILPESPFVKDAGVVLIGIKATTQQLQREYEHKETENSVRVMSLGHSQDLRTALPNSQKKTEDDKLQISPAEEILLTQRIIHRSLEILRVHQGEKEKYIVNGVSCLQCLKRSFSCWLGCIPGQRYDPYVDVEEVENELKARKKKLRSFRSVGADVCADDSDSDDDEELAAASQTLAQVAMKIGEAMYASQEEAAAHADAAEFALERALDRPRDLGHAEFRGVAARAGGRGRVLE